MYLFEPKGKPLIPHIYVCMWLLPYACFNQVDKLSALFNINFSSFSFTGRCIVDRDCLPGDSCVKQVCVNYCESLDPCENGGTCQKAPTEDPDFQYYCICPPTFTGRTCGMKFDPVTLPAGNTGATTEEPVFDIVCNERGTCEEKDADGNCLRCVWLLQVN